MHNKLLFFMNGLRNNKKFLNASKISILLLLCSISFSFMAFDSRPVIHYVTYALYALLSLIVIFGCVIYKKFAFDYKFLYLFGFLIWATICTLVGSRNFRSLLTLYLIVYSCLLFYFSFLIVDNIWAILISILCGLILFTIYFIIIYRNLIFSFNFSTRAGSFFGNENAVSLVFSYAILISLILGFSGKKWFYYLFLLLIPVFSICSFSTGSKKGLLLLVIFLLACVIIKFFKYKIALFTILGVTVALLALLINLPFMASIKERFVGFFDIFSGNASDTSSLIRLLMIKESYYRGSKNLLFGLGVGGFSNQTIFHTYSHNNGGEIFCNFGIIGFILYHAVFVLSAKDIRHNVEHSPYCVCFLLAIILFTFTNVYYLDKMTSLMIAVLLYLTKRVDFLTYLQGIFKYSKKQENELCDFWEISL